MPQGGARGQNLGHPNKVVYCSLFIQTTSSGLIHVREMSGKFGFFQGQGIVREFCDVSGKNEILQKYQGNVREYYISA